MSGISVNIVNPAGGAPLLGGGSGSDLAGLLENRRQFDASQKQQGQQFEQQMGQRQQEFERGAGQEDQRIQLSKGQLELQKKESERQKQMAQLEAAMMIGRQRYDEERTRILEDMDNSIKAQDYETLKRLHPQLDEVMSGLSDYDAKMNRLSLLEHLLAATAQGESVDGVSKPPLLQQDFAEAMQTHLASEHQREQDILDAVGLALTSGDPSPPGDYPSDEKIDPKDPDWAKKMSARLAGKPLPMPMSMKSQDLDVFGMSIEVGAPTPAEEVVPRQTVGIADRLVQTAAPALGLSGDETVKMRTMLQRLESAAAMNGVGVSRARDAALAEAGGLAQQLVAGGVEADKIAVLMQGLTKKGHAAVDEMRKSWSGRRSEQEAKGEKFTESFGGDEVNYMRRVEHVGVLGMGLRDEKGQLLFRPQAPIREVDRDGKKVLEKGGFDTRTLLEEATADFIDNGKFDRRAEYLNGLPPALRTKVEGVLLARQKNFENATSLQGFDPKTFNLREEKARTESGRTALVKKRGAIENEAFMEGRKARTGAQKKASDLRAQAADKILAPVYARLEDLLKE